MKKYRCAFCEKVFTDGVVSEKIDNYLLEEGCICQECYTILADIFDNRCLPKLGEKVLAGEGIKQEGKG